MEFARKDERGMFEESGEHAREGSRRGLGRATRDERSQRGLEDDDDRVKWCLLRCGGGDERSGR